MRKVEIVVSTGDMDDTISVVVTVPRVLFLGVAAGSNARTARRHCPQGLRQPGRHPSAGQA
jgi:hypothetical protein